jgi:hypothetical protein
MTANTLASRMAARSCPTRASGDLFWVGIGFLTPGALAEPAEVDAGLPAGAHPDGVAIVFMVSAFPTPENELADSISSQLHGLLSQANLIRVVCRGVAALSESPESKTAELTAGSLGEALQISVSWQKARREQRSLPVNIEATQRSG